MATGKQKRAFVKTEQQSDGISAPEDVPAKKQKRGTKETNKKLSGKPNKPKHDNKKGKFTKNGDMKKKGKFDAKPKGKTFQKGDKGWFISITSFKVLILMLKLDSSICYERYLSLKT